MLVIQNCKTGRRRMQTDLSTELAPEDPRRERSGSGGKRTAPPPERGRQRRPARDAHVALRGIRPVEQGRIGHGAARRLALPACGALPAHSGVVLADTWHTWHT